MGRYILLTGTGTIGRELLLALVRRTDSRVAILMRDLGRRAVPERACRLFDTLELASAERARVDVLKGDVTRPDLGLDQRVLARILRDVSVIIHTAAATSLVADRAMCDTVNRGGTAHVLTIANAVFRRGHLHRYVHLSTALVAGGGSVGTVREDELTSAPVHLNAYEWSKYEAERIVRNAMADGLPVTIFRPSMVVGETATGRTRDFDVIYPLMRITASGYVTQFPADPDARVHLAPLDFVIDAIMRGIEEYWTTSTTFHLTSPDPPTVSQLFECVAFFPPGASRPTICSPEQFDGRSCGSRERELLESVRFCFPYFNSHLSFETSNTKRLVPLPVTDPAYLDRLGRYAVESGYIRRLDD
jgi:thioester reductase-like protein